MRGVCARCRERGRSSSRGSTPQKNHHTSKGAIGAPLDAARLIAPIRAGGNGAPARRTDAQNSSATRPAHCSASHHNATPTATADVDAGATPPSRRSEGATHSAQPNGEVVVVDGLRSVSDRDVVAALSAHRNSEHNKAAEPCGCPAWPCGTPPQAASERPRRDGEVEDASCTPQQRAPPRDGGRGGRRAAGWPRGRPANALSETLMTPGFANTV